MATEIPPRQPARRPADDAAVRRPPSDRLGQLAMRLMHAENQPRLLPGGYDGQPDERGEIADGQATAARRWVLVTRGKNDVCAICCSYLAPFLVLCVFCFLEGPTVALAARNLVRDAYGPLSMLLWGPEFSLDSLLFRALVCALLRAAWLMVVCFSGLRRLPPVVHALLGFAWCLSGWWNSLAI